MRVYLDNCCYNRPFDEQGQLRVRLESEAKLQVQAMMRSGEVEYVWSDILSREVLDNPFPHRRNKILEWRKGASRVVSMTTEVIADANDLSGMGIHVADALHIASAAAVDCDFFITTDVRLLRRIRQFKATRIVDPMEFLVEVEEYED